MSGLAVLRNYLKIAGLLVFGLTMQLAVAGKTIYVDDGATGANNGSTWADAYNCLQDALADANSAEKPVEIRVAQGIYRPDQGTGITPGDRQATFRLINGVAIRGGYAGFGEKDPDTRDVQRYETILSGDLGDNDVAVNDSRDLFGEPSRAENSYHVVTASGTDGSAMLDGFVITAGNAERLGPSHGNQSADWNEDANTPPRPPPPKFGGAGIFSEMGSPMLVNCEVMRNVTMGYGGGMANVYGSPVLINCEFDENSAAAGGAIANYVGNINVSDCVFFRNIASNGDGGAIEGSGSLILTDCAFSLNWSDDEGGAVSITGDLSTTRLTDCTFRNNLAGYQGGAIYLYSGRAAILIDCAFVSNSATKGGAMANEGSSPILTRCIFSGNRATYMGAGVSNYGSRPVLANCTFTGNLALNGTAIACASHMGQTSEITMVNCVFWDGGDEIYNDDDSAITTTYSNVEAGWPGNGNIDADPCFVNPGYWDPNGTPENPNDDFWVDGDYHLESQAGRYDPVSGSWVKDDVTSPCIDAGDPASPVGQEPFPDGGRVNMGAYGGTAEASKSHFGEPVCETVTAGDINGDCKVDFSDFAIMSLHWLEDNTPAGPVTATYVFQRDPNALVVSGGFAGHIHETYSVEGEFKLMVNPDEGSASFEDVDATLSEEVFFLDPYTGEPVSTDSLDVLFQMTDLDSTDVNDTTANFILKRYPGFPEADIHLELTFLDDSVGLVGSFCEPACDGVCYHLDAVAVAQPAVGLKE